MRLRRVMGLPKTDNPMCRRIRLQPIRLSARLRDMLTDESTEDDIWPHNSCKHQVYT